MTRLVVPVTNPLNKKADHPKTKGAIPSHLQLKGARRFIIFNTKSLKVPEAWQLLRTLLDKGVLQSIIKLKRVTSAKSLPRIDMWVRKDLALHLGQVLNARSRTRNLEAVTAFKGLYNKGASKRPIAAWRVVPWQPLQDRQAVQRVPKSDPREYTSTFMTLNVNGLEKKHISVLDVLMSNKVAVACLQESLVSSQAYPVQMPGYKCYSQPWVEGFRGLVVLVDNRYASYEVEHRLGNGVIHVRVSGIPGIEGPINVVGVYLPSGGNYRGTRTQRIKDIVHLASGLIDEPHGDKVVLLGDWNKPSSGLDKLVGSADLRISRIVPKGMDWTRFPRNGKPSAIDHVLVSAEMKHLLKRPRVVREIIMSDHRPVITPVRAQRAEQQVEHRTNYRFDTGMIRKHSELLVNHNRWEALLDLQDTSTVNEVTEAFNESFADVTDDIGIRIPCVERKVELPRRLKKLLKRKQKHDKEWSIRHERGEEVPEILEVKRRRAAKAYKTEHKLWVEAQRAGFYERVAADAIAGDTKNVWRRLTSTVGNKIHKNSIVREGAFNPAINVLTGELITDLPGVVNVHADHYERVASYNEDGHRDRWDDWIKLEEKDMHEELEGINESIQFQEVLEAIRRMNRNTATGRDDVHVNVLKALVPEEGWLEFLAKNPGFTRPDWSRKDLKASELPKFPRTGFGNALYKVLTTVWDKGEIPDAWKTVDVVSLLKPGFPRPEVIDGYRGISLISVTEKVLLQIMTERLYMAVERKGILVPEQAGFRRREEAIAQVIAVADIVRRRHLAGRSTIGIFVDFKKAYDRVPHGALIHVLAKNGVRGNFLKLVNNIYAESNMSVKINGASSRTFPMYRGVRQGCPLSPLLFLLFINTILDECVLEGVKVPGLGWQKKKGAMYADDLLCLVEKKEQAQAVITKLEQWCEKWGMELGLAKCGVMMWRWSDLAPTLDEVHFTTKQGEIPVVTEYKYLGIWLDTSLVNHRSGESKWGSSLEMVNSKRRAAEGHKAAHALRPILTDRYCPLSLKILLIQNLIVPLMTYGAEWTGFRQKHAEPLQRVVNMAVRWAIGVSAKSVTYDFLTLTYELRVPTMESEMAGRRTRLHAKTTKGEPEDRLKTQLQELVDHEDIPEVKSKQAYSWPRSGRKWLKALPSGKNFPEPEKREFGLHFEGRKGDESFFGSVQGAFGHWEPVWTEKQLLRIKKLRKYLAENHNWGWRYRDENNFWYGQDIFTHLTFMEWQTPWHIKPWQVKEWIGEKWTDALEYTDEHLRTLVQPVKGSNLLPMRPWAMRGHLYEAHTRSNGFSSCYVNRMLEIATGHDLEGVPTTETAARKAYLQGKEIPGKLDLEAEWEELQIGGGSTRGDPIVNSAVHNTRTRITERQFGNCRTEGFKWYNHWGFGATRDFIRHAGSRPRLAEGVRWLTAIRCRAFPRVQEAIIRAKRANRQCDLQQGKCPLCNDDIQGGWEWAHLLVSCKHQICCTARDKWLEPMVSYMEEVVCREQPLEKLPHNTGVSCWNRPRLGAVAIYLVGGVVNDSFDNSIHLGFGHLPLTVFVKNKNFGALYVRTASFLQAVAPLWEKHLGCVSGEGIDLESHGTQVAECGAPLTEVEKRDDEISAEY